MRVDARRVVAYSSR
jgi:hypothetical protein